MKTLRIIDLGTLPYEEAYFLQKAIVADIKHTKSDDSLLLAEHPNIFTIGRSGSRENILVDEKIIENEGIKIINVDRGGDITFHGKGQLIIYPIFDLNRHSKDIRLFLRNLEDVIKLTLFEYGLAAEEENNLTGIWVGGSKIAFIGIGISNWITYHGISINVNVDKKYFSMIRPCGIDGLRVGSLQDILKTKIDIVLLKKRFSKRCCEVFGFERSDHHSKDAFMVKEGIAE